MDNSPLFLPLAELYSCVRNGSITSLELVEASNASYRARGDHDNAFSIWNGQRALDTARLVDAMFAKNIDKGPLMGLPVSVKDIYGVPGLPTYAGTSTALPVEWETAGPIVAELIKQHAMIIGKTQSVEFAFGGLGINQKRGTPRNPWAKAQHRVPGGSSAGAGVALISGTACISLGTDTSGSVRVPASMTGVTGLKLTAGHWPMNNVVPLSKTLDSPGLLANRVADLQFAFNALNASLGQHGATPPILKPSLVDLGAITFGICEDYFWEECDPGISESVLSAIHLLENHGARLVPFTLQGTHEAFALFEKGGIAAAELFSFLDRELPGRFTSLDPIVRQRLDGVNRMLAQEYLSRCEIIASLSARAAKSLKRIDALLVPTVTITPPTVTSLQCESTYVKANLRALRNTVIGNLMGLCALTLPTGKDSTGMPAGLQLLAGPGQEDKLLAIGSSIENLIGNRFDLLGPPPPQTGPR